MNISLSLIRFLKVALYENQQRNGWMKESGVEGRMCKDCQVPTVCKENGGGG